MKQMFVPSVLALLLAGCPGGSGNSTPTPPQITGVWKADSGVEVFDNLGDWNAQYLQFADKGSGKVFVAQVESGLKACPAMVYAVLNANVLSISAQKLLSNGAVSFTLELPDANTLRLTDENGNAQVFKKTSDVPAAAQCESIAATAKLEDLAVSTNRSDTALMGDGTNLRVSDGKGSAQVITLPTGTLGTSEVMNTAPGQFTYGVLMQAGDYWASCHCGNDSQIKRWKPGQTAAVTTIDTQVDLAKQVTIDGAATDGTFLWLAGYSFNVAQYLLLKVNPTTKTLVESTQLKFAPDGLTFHNGKPWTMVNAFGTNLVELDTTTGKASRVLALPTPKLGTFYRGLVAQNGKLYVMRYKSPTSISIDTFQP